LTDRQTKQEKLQLHVQATKITKLNRAAREMTTLMSIPCFTNSAQWKDLQSQRQIQKAVMVLKTVCWFPNISLLNLEREMNQLML